MALNNLTRIGNSGFGTDTSINTTGIVTAASFSGDGSALTGVTAVGSGVVVREEGSNVGTAQTINFIGTGVTATLSGGIANIEIATSGGGGGGGLSNVVEDTTPQLGGNLDLNSKNITGTGDISITGDATFSGDLDVDGHVDLDNVSIAGVVTATTFVGALTGDASGNAATATALQNARTIGGVSFDGSANINLPGVNAAGNQDTSGTASVATNVTVANEASDTECFVMFGVNATGNNAPKSSSSLKYNSSTGGLTAGSFIGDGSGLTGITASGSGVIIRDDGSLVGTAGTINFGSNVSVSPISAGVVTVTASAGSIPGISTSGTTQLNNLAVAGIGTFTSGLTVPSTGAVTVGPNFTLSSNSNGSLVELRNSGTNSSDTLRYRAQTHQFMNQAATTTRMSVGNDGVSLNHDNIPVLKTVGAGVSIGIPNYPATLFADQISVSGVSTFTGTAFLDQLRVSGISTLNSIYIGNSDEIRFGAGSGNNDINPTGDFKIRHDHVNAFNMLYDDITGHRARFQSQIGGVTNNAFEFRRASNTLAMMRESEIILYSGGSAKFQTAATGAVVTGILTATTFSGSGASLTTLNASELDSGTIPDARFPATLPAISGANLTNLPSDTPADTDVQVTYDVSSNGSSAYRFTGPGYSGADDNPDLYLVRGQRYRFINGTGSSHPFRIQSNTSGTAYTDGVSGSQSGTQDFNVQYDAPTRLYYQCTIHSGMIGNIYIVGGSDWRMTDVATSAIPEIFTNLNVGIGTDNPSLTSSAGGLHIAGGNAALKLQNTSNGDWAFVEYADETNTTKYIQGYRDGNGAYGIRPGTSLNADPGITVTSDSKIGINNQTPLYPMHFKNAMASTPSYIHMEVTGTNTVGGGAGIQFDTSASNAQSNNGLYLAQISGERSSSNDGSNSLVFKTTKAATFGDDGNTHSPKTRMTIDENGNVNISDGNLVVASGHGIDFSATANGGTGTPSELLDDYEEGFFTPTIYAGADNGSGGAPAFAIQAGRYVKIGRKVHCDIYIRFANGDLSTGVHARIGNLPFAIANESYGNVGASNLTRGGGVSTFHDTTSDITTCYGTNNTGVFYLYKDGGTGFIFGGSNNANLNGKYWIGIFEYICTP